MFVKYKKNEKGNYIGVCEFCGNIFEADNPNHLLRMIFKHIIDSKLPSHESYKEVARAELDKGDRIRSEKKAIYKKERDELEDRFYQNLS